MTIKYKRICLIGMSGVGKSYFGNLIAKKYKLPFLDTDTLIEASIPISIKEYLKTHDEESFLSLEEKMILGISFPKQIIIATGGSTVYSKKTMSYLKQHCTVIYLNDSFKNIQKRTTNFDKRGIVMKGRKSIENVYKDRLNLYKTWSDITITYPNNISFKNMISLIEKKIL